MKVTTLAVVFDSCGNNLLPARQKVVTRQEVSRRQKVVRRLKVVRMLQVVTGVHKKSVLRQFSALSRLPTMDISL